MNTMFENLDIWIDEEVDDKPFVIASKNREPGSWEEWIVNSFTKEEAKKIRDFIDGKLKEMEEAQE